VISSEHEKFGQMFGRDRELCTEALPNVWKLETRAYKKFEGHYVIAIVQVKTKCGAVKHACEFNLQR